MAKPRSAHAFPRATAFEHLLGSAFLGLSGWRVEGELPPDVDRAVLIAAPHTTGWDLPYMLATAGAFRVRLRFLGKHTLFAGLGGPMMRWLGGIPVDRRSPQGLVAAMAQRFKEESMLVAIAPTGTRSRAGHWKSGFYRIAHAAQVPIVCGFLDFGRKVCGVGPTIMPNGDIHEDMKLIVAFYADKRGMRPDLTTPVRIASPTPAGPNPATVSW